MSPEQLAPLMAARMEEIGMRGPATLEMAVRIMCANPGIIQIIQDRRVDGHAVDIVGYIKPGVPVADVLALFDSSDAEFKDTARKLLKDLPPGFHVVLDVGEVGPQGETGDSPGQ